MQRFHLYFDDSGSRRPDHKPHPVRADGMDYFALGGILIAQDDIGSLIAAHNAFTGRWNITYPLHSTQIRGHRGPFAWLGKDAGRDEAFRAELEAFLTALPVTGIACAIHRPGYVARYAARYQGQPWLMCKTAFAILIERSAKYAERHDGELEVFFEQSGRHEDRDIKAYGRALKRDGMPFDPGTSGGYGALQAADFRRLVLGEPRERTKKTPMIQIADLMLYPMVKGGYDRSYAPYQTLLQAGRLVDTALAPADWATLGIKYSCFDEQK